jgi:Surface antigen variable number repeat
VIIPAVRAGFCYAVDGLSLNKVESPKPPDAMADTKKRPRSKKEFRMKQILVSIIAICYSAGTAHPAQERPIMHVGNVFIIGNTITQDRLILEAVNLLPGRILRQRDVRLAQSNLLKLGLFKVDRRKKIYPRVLVLDSPGPFKDILIKLEEKPTTKVRPLWQMRPDAGWVAGLVIEERNFDPWRFPTCVEDFMEGKAFRGGGEKWRIELGLSTLRKGSLPFCVFVRLAPETNWLALQNHAWNILSKSW